MKLQILNTNTPNWTIPQIFNNFYHNIRVIRFIGAIRVKNCQVARFHKNKTDTV